MWLTSPPSSETPRSFDTSLYGDTKASHWLKKVLFDNWYPVNTEVITGNRTKQILKKKLEGDNENWEEKSETDKRFIHYYHILRINSLIAFPQNW